IRWDREVPDRPSLARPAALPRVLPRRQRRRDRGQPPDGLDGNGGASVPARRRVGGASGAAGRGRRVTRRPMRLPPRPTIYEINTAVWLERLGRERGRPLELAEVPAAVWDALADLPVDAVWLMGVWQRSPEGLRIASTDPGLEAGNRAALPD